IGQPDFDVPDEVKHAAAKAIADGFNRYTQTQGIKALLDKVGRVIANELPNWKPASNTADGYQTLITSGVPGGLRPAIITCVRPGDEVLVPDPYFVMDKH